MMMNAAETTPQRAGEPANRRREMSEEDRKAASALLDAAMASDNPEKATRMRIVAALLHGQEHAKITRNLGVSEKVILTCRETYEAKGVTAFIGRARRSEQ
jgi:hypothetical protein